MCSRFLVPTVAAAIDLVVQLSLGPDGIRRVDEVVAVSGRVEADVIGTVGVFARRDGALACGGGRPPHPERFAGVSVDIGSVLAGRADRSSLPGLVSAPPCCQSVGQASWPTGPPR